MEENSQPISLPTPAPLTWAPPAPAKKKSNKMVIAIVIAVVAVLIIAAFAFTMMNTAANVKSKANQMTIKLSELPAGWHSSTTTIDTSEYKGVEIAYSVFNNSIHPSVVWPWCEISCIIIVYGSTSQAKTDFEDLRGDSGSAMSEVSDCFEQCLVGETNVSEYEEAKIYAFQEKNVCGLLKFTSAYGYDLDQEWVNEMLDLQESKIV